MDTSLELRDQVLSLVSKIISPVRVDVNSPLVKATNRLEAFVKESLMPILNRASPDNSSEIVNAFQLSLERFEEFTLFPAFESKQLIGVGGAFSSGKSKLLNTIIGENILPVQTDPSTVVPTYIIHSNHEEVGVINIFKVRNRMSLADFDSISYDFINKHKIELRHLIKRAFISSSRLSFDHLSLLDTPGYSKADSASYSIRTDEAVAREQLSTADYVIWVMDIENGTLKDSDIEFIHSLNLTTPLLMVLSKADKKDPDEVEEVRQEVIVKLASIGLSAEAVIPFSASGDSSYPVEPILDWLRLKNKPKVNSNIPKHFKRLFSAYHNYYEKQLSDTQRRLRNVKLISTAFDSSDENSVSCMQALVVEAKNDRIKYSDLDKSLALLRETFFEIVKSVGDIVGISLPEPNEIDMIDSDFLSVNDLLKDYVATSKTKRTSADEHILCKISTSDQVTKELKKTLCERNKPVS